MNDIDALSRRSAVLILSSAALSGCAHSFSGSINANKSRIHRHQITSKHQRGTTEIRILLPDPFRSSVRYPVVYILPVEPAGEHIYGNGLNEINRLGLQRKYQAVFVEPTFSDTPWYADHPTDTRMHQETYFLNDVLPWVERNLPVVRNPDGRLLLGFSKSGWGAWSLLLRHPDKFGRAVAWDAPLMMQWPTPYPGSQQVFGTQENFETYRLERLVRQAKPGIAGDDRLILAGCGNFCGQHAEMRQLLDALRVPYSQIDAPFRAHEWSSGWISSAVGAALSAP